MVNIIESRPERPDAMVWVVAALYQVLALLLLPLVIARFLLLSRKSPSYRTGLGARFGLAPKGNRGGAWIFAASLGELRAVSPLVRELSRHGVPVRLTQNTAEGLDEANRLFGADPKIAIHFAPLDFVPFVWLFLRKTKPEIGVVVESELWPGYLLTAWLTRIPMFQVNGNLLDRTIERDSRIMGGVRLRLLRLYTLITTKTDGYVERYLRAGVAGERIGRVGELKFDQEKNQDQIASGTKAKKGWSPTNPVFLIASSVEAEEQDLADCVFGLLQQNKDIRVVWAPRSPQTFDDVASRLGDVAVRRSEVLDEALVGEIPRDVRVLLADSIGEMSFNYELSDLVFVGASLVDRGGHTPVEPLSVGRPVLMGPSIFGVTYPAIEARDAGALRIVNDIDDLTDSVLQLVERAQDLKDMKDQARAFAADHLGAAERTMTYLKPFLADRSND